MTRITFAVPRATRANLIILDVLGREIAILVEGERTAGVHEAKWNAVGVPSGIYFYRLQAGDFVETKKMTLLKQVSLFYSQFPSPHCSLTIDTLRLLLFSSSLQRRQRLFDMLLRLQLRIKCVDNDSLLIDHAGNPARQNAEEV
ncbi:T9SS C-terminal target domain-containing protein [bacterium]|nr:MAG: T9SS C-terminal target domain-containing protein [bacterium]